MEKLLSWTASFLAVTQSVRWNKVGSFPSGMESRFIM